MSKPVKKDNTYCCVPQCTSRGSKNPDLSFHLFPNEKYKISVVSANGSKSLVSRRTEWIRILRIGKDVSSRMTVCSKHFTPKDYSSTSSMFKRPRLKPYAVPSCNLPVLSIDKSSNSQQKSKAAERGFRYGEINRNIQYISCCISGCQSKSPRKIEYNAEMGEENILMFPVPRTGKLMCQWKQALKGTVTELTWNDHICERHFLENDIERYHRTKTPSGDIIEIRKKLPTLKPDAVPIKFLKPSLFLIAEDPSKKLQSVSQNSFAVNCERNLCDNSNLTLNSCDSVDCVFVSKIEICYDSPEDSPVNLSDLSVKSVPEQISHKTKCLPYSELVENVQLVKKPSKFWSVVCTDQFTIFARWNNEFIVEKRLVIERSFTIRVFLKDWEVEMTDLVDVISIDDVSSLLEKVENYNMDVKL